MYTQTIIQKLESASGVVYTAYAHTVLVEGKPAESCGVEIRAADTVCRQDDITPDRAAVSAFLHSLYEHDAQPSELYVLAEDFLVALSCNQDGSVVY